MPTKTTKKKTTKKKTTKRGARKTGVTVGNQRHGDAYNKIYEEFAMFSALPKVAQIDIYGFYKQKDFAKHHDIPEPRLSEHKRTQVFLKRLSKHRKEYFKLKITEPLQALLEKQKTNPNGADIKVLLDFAEEMPKGGVFDEEGNKAVNELMEKLGGMIPD